MSQSGGGRSPYGGTMQPYGGGSIPGSGRTFDPMNPGAGAGTTGDQAYYIPNSTWNQPAGNWGSPRSGQVMPSMPPQTGFGVQPRSTGVVPPTSYGGSGTGIQPRSTAPAGGGVWNPLDPGIATAGPSIMQAGSFGQPTSAMMGAGLLGMPSSNVQAAMSSRSSAQPGLVNSVGQTGANQMNNAFQAGGTQYHPWLNQLTDLGLQAPTAGAMANQWASEGLGTVGPGGQWQWAPGKGWDSATANVYGG